jgi:hypothetical protein
MKLVIEQTIINIKWKTFVNTLRNTHRHTSFTKTKYVQTNIRRDGFWNICANFVHMVEPFILASRAFNGKQPGMGNVWFVMKPL